MGGTGNFGKSDAEKWDLLRKHADVVNVADRGFVTAISKKEVAAMPATELYKVIQIFDDHASAILKAEAKDEAAPHADETPSDEVGGEDEDKALPPDPVKDEPVTQAPPPSAKDSKNAASKR